MLLGDVSSVFVLAKTSKLRVTQMIAIGPFQVFDPRHNFGTDPYALFHIFSGQSGSPFPFSASGRLKNGHSGTTSGLSLFKRALQIR